MDNIIQKEEYSYDEIMENLKNVSSDDFIKVFSILDLELLKNQNDAHIFINHLTNHPNPIREVVALKLEELDVKYFLDEFSLSKLEDALIDINPNVCRAVCSFIDKNNSIKQLLSKRIIDKTLNHLKSITQEEIKGNDKSHAKNKKIFSLYWLLEAISNFDIKKDNSKVLEILKTAVKFKDYTIREKTAKILAKMENPPIELLKSATIDTNFYVNFYIKNNIYDNIIKETV